MVQLLFWVTVRIRVGKYILQSNAQDSTYLSADRSGSHQVTWLHVASRHCMMGQLLFRSPVHVLLAIKQASRQACPISVKTDHDNYTQIEQEVSCTVYVLQGRWNREDSCTPNF